MLYKKPRGMFITIHDRGSVDSILANWPEEDVKVGKKLLFFKN